MSFVLLKIHQLDDLTVEQLQYISKPILLEYYTFQIRNVWSKLPRHIRADPEIQDARNKFDLNTVAVELTEPIPLLVKVSNTKELSYEQIQYIPKTTLLDHFEDEIDAIWDKLPTHIKLDKEIRDCRRCKIHHEPPQELPAPMKKNCCICNATKNPKNLWVKGC